LATTPTFIAVTEGAGKKLAADTYTENSQVVLDQKVILGEQYLPTYVVSTAAVALQTANSHALEIMAGSSLNVYIRRIEIYAAVAATTSTLVQLNLFRLSSAGNTGTAITPAPLDSSDSASGATALALPTNKGTETTLLATPTIMLVSTVTSPALLWLRDYDRQRSKSLRIAAGTSNGIALKNVTAVTTAGSITVMVYLQEMSF
jgi:hypothetical protein